MADPITILSPPRGPAETLEQRFRRLEAVLTAAMGVLSDPSEIVGHPAFREIVSLGMPVVPLLLGDLEQRPRLWVWALAEITDENPVPPSDRGRIGKMTEAWLAWGWAKGYR